jgi:hypothetical protein
VICARQLLSLAGFWRALCCTRQTRRQSAAGRREEEEEEEWMRSCCCYCCCCRADRNGHSVRGKAERRGARVGCLSGFVSSLALGGMCCNLACGFVVVVQLLLVPVPVRGPSVRGAHRCRVSASGVRALNSQCCSRHRRGTTTTTTRRRRMTMAVVVEGMTAVGYVAKRWMKDGW